MDGKSRGGIGTGSEPTQTGRRGHCLGRRPHVLMTKKVRFQEWRPLAQIVKPDGVTLRVMSYQEVLGLVRNVVGDEQGDGWVWTELPECV